MALLMEVYTKSPKNHSVLGQFRGRVKPGQLLKPDQGGLQAWRHCDFRKKQKTAPVLGPEMRYPEGDGC